MWAARRRCMAPMVFPSSPRAASSPPEIASSRTASASGWSTPRRRERSTGREVMGKPVRRQNARHRGMGAAGTSRRGDRSGQSGLPPRWESRPSLRASPAFSGRGERRIFSSSALIRSPDRWAARWALRRMAARVPSSMEKPSWAAKRTARSIRRASSAKRVSGSPTQRISLRNRSSCPPYRSITMPRSSRAMALTVKSRRARSSARVASKSTASGWRPSA